MVGKPGIKAKPGPSIGLIKVSEFKVKKFNTQSFKSPKRYQTKSETNFPNKENHHILFKMSTTKASLIILAVVAGVALAQAAGGIKGQRQAEESQQRIQGLKRPQQQYQPPPPPPPPAPQAARPIPQAIKGPGRVAPVFSATKVSPVIQQQQQEQQVIQQQEQQQETEIDPNAAAQDSAPAVIAPAAAAPSEEEANPRPEPYAFNYAFESGDSATSGSSQREETQDASGKVTGFYTLRGEDGRDRRVDYIADASGFRATISTNELGTAPKDSADVDWNAQSPTDAQLRAAESATQAARQRALLNPQPAASTNQGKLSSPRRNQQQDQYTAAASKGVQQQITQLQEPFEQIRQTELRARKSRHAPFYLYTV